MYRLFHENGFGQVFRNSFGLTRSIVQDKVRKVRNSFGGNRLGRFKKNIQNGKYHGREGNLRQIHQIHLK